MTASKRKPQPISAHPFFPVIVGLWCAALLGLGSFAVPREMLEAPVIALGLPKILPAAAPPLGFTARALLALVLTVVGAGAGFMLGRRLGREKADEALRARSFSPREPASAAPRRPLVISEEQLEPLDAEPEAEAEPYLRRGTFAAAEADFDVEAASGDFAAVHDPLAFDDLLGDARAAGEQAECAIAQSGIVEVGGAAPPVVLPPPFAKPSLAPPPRSVISPLLGAPLEGLGLVQLVERLGAAIAVRTVWSSAVPQVEAAVSLLPASAPAPVAAPVIAHPPVTIMPRFASHAALSDPDDHDEEAPAERVVPLRPLGLQPVMPPVDEDAEDDDFVVSMPRFLSAATHPIAPAAAEIEADDLDDDLIDDEEADAGPRADSEDVEERYSSLLDMAPAPLRHELVQIDDADAAEADLEYGAEPVVVFPGQSSRIAAPFDRPPVLGLVGSPLAAPGQAAPSAPLPSALVPDPEEADRALREALATLQRMTAKG